MLYLIVPGKFEWKQLIFCSSFVSQGHYFILMSAFIYLAFIYNKIRFEVNSNFFMQFFDIANVHSLSWNPCFGRIPRGWLCKVQVCTISFYLFIYVSTCVHVEFVFMSVSILVLMVAQRWENFEIWIYTWKQPNELNPKIRNLINDSDVCFWVSLSLSLHLFFVFFCFLSGSSYWWLSGGLEGDLFSLCHGLTEFRAEKQSFHRFHKTVAMSLLID